MRVAGALLVAGLAVLAAGGASAQERKPCDYDSRRPAPLKVAKPPGEVIAGRRAAVRVITQGYRGRKFGTRLTRLTIRFERIDDGEETFSASLLRAYRRSRPGDNIGYDVRMVAGTPGERAIVEWTDAGSKEACTGRAESGDVRVAERERAQRPLVSSRSKVTDAARGDSALLRIGGRGRGCPLTDPAPLTVVARSASITKRLRLNMACGAWRRHEPLRVDRFTLLPEDGRYLGAARLYVSPRAAPTPGAQLSLTVYKAGRRLGRESFRVVPGPRIVAAG